MPTKHYVGVLLALGAVSLGMEGQTVSTEILGLVTDSTGAVIPSAVVRITRLATGDVRTTTTNESGNYVFPVIEIGEYEVSCSAAGPRNRLCSETQCAKQASIID